ncbi:MAG: hypothetical protein D6759_06080, partial [Chloroflexi bacterium]
DPALILSDAHTVQFDPHADLWLDVDAFESLASHDDLTDLQSAVALYRGAFLEGFYDDWVINERYRLESLFFEVLTRLMTGYEARGEPDAALAIALQLLNHDPLREDAHRLAMRAYCRLGQRNAALDQYRRCREVIRAELGAEPMVETTELYQAILEGRFAVEPVPKAPPVEVPAVEPSAPSGWSPLDVRAPGRLVGRERELAFLHRCWQEVRAGQGGLALISGEAGLGKTRLVETFASRLRWQGVRVLWGRCYEFERLLPYQPIAEALRTLLPALTPAELADFPAWSVAEVARLVPEVSERYPGLPAPAPVGPDREQARLFDGVARFLATLSSRGACLIVLEDLHWASESTLQLLHYLVRRLSRHPVLLVGTLRPEAMHRQHPLWNLQQPLVRAGLARTCPLKPLSPEAVERLVVEMSGAGEAVIPLARRLYRESEGNPFFVIEMVKALFETGLIRLEEGVWWGDFSRISQEAWPLPVGLSAAIQARVRRLSDNAQEALHLAAVLGREFDFELLNAVWGRGEEATLDALDEMLRHRIVDEGTGPMGRDYAFTHHKIQEAVYAGIPRRRRQHAHARVGATMERLYRSQREELASELAFHFLQGRSLDASLTEKAITYLLQAGDRARGLYAHCEAIDFYRQALTLLKEQGAYERAARTLMKLGLTHHIAFDFRQARRAYEEGFALWQRAGTARSVVPPPAPHALRVAWDSPLTLDPILADDVASASVIEQLFSGLVELSPEMDVVPDLARSWEVLEGGRTYIFHLREDGRWSDGRPVTAGDFVYAWKRLLNPATGSPIAHRLFDIKGARAFHRGEVGEEGVGVWAADEATLVVELERPTSYFVHLLAIPAAYPLPRHRVEAYGEAWTEVGKITTNGPFNLEAWNQGESIVLSRNPTYHSRFGGNARQVELFLIEDPPARLARYEADGLDILDLWGLPPPEMDRARQRHAGEYVSVPVPRTSYLGFHTGRPPFDDLRVRRAFVLAVDRERLAAEAMRSYHFPATGGFIPPGIPGHSPGIGLPYDPERAQHLLAEAGYPGGRDLPPVVCLTSGSTTVSEHLQAQWRENLGVEVRWERVDYGRLRRRIEGEPPHLFILSWGAAYPDPDFFLRVSPIRPDSRWRDETYEGLVEQARRVTDQGARMALYRQADRMLIEEAVVMPLTYGRAHLLVKPWVKQFPLSAVSQWFWKEVVIAPH